MRFTLKFGQNEMRKYKDQLFCMMDHFLLPHTSMASYLAPIVKSDPLSKLTQQI